MIQIAEYLRPEPSLLWKLVKQAGVNHAVGQLPKDDGGAERPWDIGPLTRAKALYEEAGITLSVIESSPPMQKIRLGLPGRDEEIEWFCTLLRNMGALGIPVLCYNFMAVLGWLRTSSDIVGRGGALVTGYDHAALRD